MHTNIIPGSVVIISNLSKPSYYLYKAYLRFSPLLICPCKVKRDVPFIVEDIFDNNVVLLKGKTKDIITMTYLGDLELVFEN